MVYNEIVSVTNPDMWGVPETLIAMGSLIFFVFIIIYLGKLLDPMIRRLKITSDEEESFYVLERNYLKEFAKKHNIDLDEEIIKYREFNKKDLSKLIKARILEEYNNDWKKEIKKK